MKILHVMESLGRGGAEHLLLTVAPALAARGHQCDVVVLWPPYDLAGDLEGLGIRVFRLDVKHRWQVSAALGGLLPLLRQGYQVVHSHLFFASFYMSLGSFFTARFGRVVTFHNCDWDSYPARNALHRLRKSVESYLMRNRVDLLIAISPAVAESYRRHLSVSGVRVIPNAVDGNLLSQVNPERGPVLRKYGAAEDELVVTVPGRLVHEKGHGHLLQAVQLLNSKGVFPKVVVVGDGPLRGELGERSEALGLSERLVFHPAVPHAELMQLVKASDLVVVPSTHEGFGMVALEAMLVGTPVIATSVGGLKDLVEDGVSGLLVPPAQPEALCEAMLELARSPEKRASFADCARRRALARFDIQKVVLTLEEAYLGCLSQATPTDERDTSRKD